MASGRARSLAEIAKREGIRKRYVARLVRLAFVAPRIVEAVAEGRAPAALSLQMLIDGHVALPLEWESRERLFELE